jgi:hypothetical protein
MTEDPISPEDSQPDDSGAAQPHPRRHLAPLPFGVRLLVLIVGGILILVGLAGLFLPGLQGILTLVLGAAILSLASDWVYKLQKRILQRWPSVHEPMERFRHKAHGWLSRDGDDGDPSTGD